jgi:hypothetical protein
LGILSSFVIVQPTIPEKKVASYAVRVDLRPAFSSFFLAEPIPMKETDRMKRSRFNEEQIIAILKQQENGVPTADVCREHGISSACPTRKPCTSI